MRLTSFLTLAAMLFASPVGRAECPAVAYSPEQTKEFHESAQDALLLFLREATQLPLEAVVTLVPASFIYADFFWGLCDGLHYGGLFRVQLKTGPAGRICERHYQVNYFRNVPAPFPQGASVELKSSVCH